MDEEVLVVNRKFLFAEREFSGMVLDAAHWYRRLFTSESTRFMRRQEAEKNENFLQIIPYVVLECGGMVFAYQRGKSGGEVRLHSAWSIGIGGHINISDASSMTRISSSPYALAYNAALLREVQEEVSIHTGVVREFTVGMLYDSSTPVGRVHVGVVSLWRLQEPKVVGREQAIFNGQFMDSADLLDMPWLLEPWSHLVLQQWSYVLDRIERLPGDDEDCVHVH